MTVQRLHVVGFTTDHEGLILGTRRGTKSGGFSINVDAELEEAIVTARKERGESAEPGIPRAESLLSVREMQQRLRAGQSIHQVARAAGVTDEWVGRFAVPIQAEQTQVVRQAFEMTFSKQRLGVSAQPLGISVWWNLQDRSVFLGEDDWEAGWSAFLVRDQRWVVRFEYDARKRHQVADWEVDLHTGTLISRNRMATELAFVEAGRRRRAGPPTPIAGGLVTRPAPPTHETPVPAAATPSAATAPARRRRAAAAKKAPAKKAVVRPTAKKAAAKKPTVTKAAAKKAAPRKAKKAPARKAAPRPAVAAPRVSAVRTAPVVSAVNHPRVAVPSATRPVLTPPPAPSAARRRPVDGNGQPVRRNQPLRAR